MDFVRSLAPLLLVAGLTAAPQPPPAGQVPLRDLDAPGEAYRTPGSGEGIRGHVFASTLDVAARDRRFVSAWEGGVDAALQADDSEAVPFGALYFWQHPDDTQLLRVSLAGVYDDVFFARTGPDGRELVLTFENYTLPGASGELIDGRVDDREKLEWGMPASATGSTASRRRASVAVPTCAARSTPPRHARCCPARRSTSSSRGATSWRAPATGARLAFFAHLDLGVTLAWLDRDRDVNGQRARQDDTLAALSARLSTGFLGRTRLQLGYGYGFDVVRDGERGGHEAWLLLTGRF